MVKVKHEAYVAKVEFLKGWYGEDVDYPQSIFDTVEQAVAEGWHIDELETI